MVIFVTVTVNSNHTAGYKSLQTLYYWKINEKACSNIAFCIDFIVNYVRFCNTVWSISRFVSHTVYSARFVCCMRPKFNLLQLCLELNRRSTRQAQPCNFLSHNALLDAVRVASVCASISFYADAEWWRCTGMARVRWRVVCLNTVKYRLTGAWIRWCSGRRSLVSWLFGLLLGY